MAPCTTPMNDLSLINAKLPANYKAACDALAQCHDIDECKDWSDKAAALSSYAEQSKDEQLFQYATRIRARAIRRCGELLQQVQPGKAGRPMKEKIGTAGDTNFSRKQAATDVGLSKRQKENALRLAAIPKAEFDKMVDAVNPPTIKHLAERGTKKQPRRDKITDPHETTIIAMSDAGHTAAEISAEVGIHERVIGRLLQDEQIRREAVPRIDPASLSLSAQEKLQAAIRQHKKQLDMDFENQVHAGIVRRLEQTILPEHERKYAEALAVVKARRGIMSRATFNLIRSALHPDSRKSLSDKRLTEAFAAFTKFERLLLAEAEAPTAVGSRPRTYAELMELKRRVQEDRKARRGAVRRI